MNDLVKTYTIYLSNGVEACAALIIALGALQATWQAMRLFFARPTQPEREKTDVRLRLGRWLSLALEFELAAEQFAALQATHGLSGEALQAWCREHDIFPHHLTSWETAFCAEVKEPVTGVREMRTLKDKVAKLEREIVRKNGALAEAAALLIPQKKFRALWEDEE